MKQKLLLFPGAFFLLCLSCLAQTPGGILKGTVFTSDEQPAAMVTVSIRNGRHVTFTGDDGTFVLRNIPAGNYDVEVSLVGYETLSKPVTVQNGKTTEIRLQLILSKQQLQEVIIKSNVRSYKTNTVSSSLRLQTPILETPQNIQVVTGKALADQQVISMSDGLVRNVSGAVRMEHWGDLYTNITSRGSQIQAFRNGMNVVASYWGPLTEDMSFVDHIEFVKGPAGFMLSNGDPSGLYNVVTKKPTGQTRGEASLTVGSFDLFRTTLDLDGKLSKDGRLLYRFNTSAQNKKSFRANEFNNRYVIAPVLSYQVDPKTTITAEYTLQYAKMSDVGSYYVFATDGYATLPRNFTSLPAGMPPTRITDHSAFLNLQHRFDDHWKLTAQLAYFNYRQGGSSMWPAAVNPDGTMIRAVSSWDAKSTMTMGQFFVNGEIVTGAVRHRILGGLDLSNKEYFADWGQYHELDNTASPFDTHNPGYGIPSNGYPEFDHTTPLEQRAIAAGGVIDQRYSGVYVQDELGFFQNRLRITLAGRYTYVQQSEYGGAPYTAKHGSPRVGISYSLDKHTSVYGLYDQAFIPQAGRLAGGGKVKPVTGNNMELGIKKDWAGGKWNSTVAVYRILKENELTADPNSPPNSGLSIVFGQKRSQGVEVDVRGTIINGLSVVANYAFTESVISKVADGVTDHKVGDVVPGYAKHTINTWFNYKVQAGVLKGLGASAGFTYLVGRETYWDPSPDPSVILPNYFKLDAGLSWEKDHLGINFNVFNLLNRYLYSGSYYSYLNAYYWQADPPRNLRLGLTYRF